MSFANATALWLLPPLAAAIIALYLLRMRRRELRVPATFLWPSRTDEVRANALFQRLRPSWLLFLQLLALTLIVVPLARPQIRQTGLTGEVTVLVLDTSASMGATDVKPSRFAEAKRLAREAISSAKPGDRIALVEAGPVPRVVFPLGNDFAKQLSILDNLTGTDAESDVGEAMRLASAVLNGLNSARIVLLSDGDFEPIHDFSQGKASVVYRAIGSNDENLGITALGLSDSPSGRLLYAAVRNFSTKPMETAISLYADGKAIDSRKLVVPPHNTMGETVLAPAGVRLFEAKLAGNDELAADDYAAVSADPAAALRVLRIGAEDPFVDRALALDPRVTLDRGDALPVDGGASYDIVVFDGVPSQPTKSRGTLILGRAGEGAPVRVAGSSKGPKVTSTQKSPLLDGVDFDGVFIDRAETVSASDDANVLAESTAGPLLVARQTPKNRTVYLGFTPLDSDFPLQVGFPIFIANALDYLGGEAGQGPMVVPVGRPFSVQVGTKGGSLTGPEGQKIALSAEAGSATVRDVRRIGTYKLSANGTERQFVATLRDERESSITPVPSISLSDRVVKAQSSPVRFGDFWRPLLALCLLVLAGEWWLYARRS